MTDKFKVGDKVYDIRCGAGVVEEIVDENYPILVNFNERGESYTSCGLQDIDDVNPTLLTIPEARARGYDVPKEKVKKKEVMYCLTNKHGRRLAMTDCRRECQSLMETGDSLTTVTFEWEEEI